MARLRPNGPILVFIVIFALLMAQTMGLLHGVLHHPGMGVVHSQISPTSAEPKRGHETHHHAGVAEKHSDSGLFLELFSEHLSDTDCRLYDQLCHVDATVDFALPLLLFSLPAFVLATLDGLAKARWHAQFQARGPPSPR